MLIIDAVFGIDVGVITRLDKSSPVICVGCGISLSKKVNSLVGRLVP